MKRQLPPSLEMDRYGIVRCASCGSAVTMKRPLTQRQAMVMEYVRSCIADHGIAPTVAEITAHMGYKTVSTACEHLISLERKGWLRRTYNTARGIELVADDMREEYE